MQKSPLDDINDEFDFDNDDELSKFCQEFDSPQNVALAELDYKSMPIDASYTDSITRNEKLSAMLENTIASVVGNFMDDATHIKGNLPLETTVILIHNEKVGNNLSISVDMYSDRHGIADRQSCDGIINDDRTIEFR